MVVVRYAPACVDDFIRVADELEDTFPGIIVEGVEVVEVEGRLDGVLEVRLGGDDGGGDHGLNAGTLRVAASELKDGDASGMARVVDAIRAALG